MDVFTREKLLFLFLTFLNFIFHPISITKERTVYICASLNLLMYEKT